MFSMQNVTRHRPAAAVRAAPPLTSALVLLLATGAGVSVATIYVAQPMLGVLAATFAAPAWLVGCVATLTQLGYAAGLLLLGPLADRHDRRRIILWKAIALVLALLLAAAAPSIGVLLVASAAIGVAATVAQDFVPAAAVLAPEARRGKVVGTVMTGLLLGILLSRVVSGFVAEHAGWRAMFAIAAAGVGVLGLASWRFLPAFTVTARASYLDLLLSLRTLWQQHPALRRAALSQGLLAVGFSAFWSTLAVMLHAAPFHLGSAAAGMFGLAGAAGALIAPLAGRMADRRGPELVTRLGTGLTMLAFAGMALGGVLERHTQLVVLAVGAVVFDLGVQATLIAHQTIVYGIDPAARSRLNVVLMVTMFIGMAVGSASGSLLLAHIGWMAVPGLATAVASGALLMRLWGPRAEPGAPAQCHAGGGPGVR
jgi:predicted MFS family arabinose efflux permease